MLAEISRSIYIKFHIAGLNVDDPPVLLAIPLFDPLIIPDVHGTVEKQGSADEVHAIKDHVATEVQIKDVFVASNLRFQLL